MLKGDLDIVEAFLELKGPRPELDAAGNDPRWHDGSFYAALYAAWFVEAQVSNGAWPAVYYNDCAWAIPLARDCFRTVGAEELALACESIMSLAEQCSIDHGSGGSPSREWLANSLCEVTNEGYWDVIESLWHQHADSMDWIALAAAYIRGNGWIDES